MCFPACNHTGPATLTVSVAASLQSAIADAVRAYPEAHVDVNYGGSGALAQQIVSGAPVDIFLSAAPKPMDDLAARGLLLPGTRRDLLRNDIVLIGPSIHSWQDLASSSVKRIALGDPASVPAGDYGRQVLQHLGLWDSVRDKLVLAKDVTQVVSYVGAGDADAGVVYASDATGNRVAAPPGSHAPVVYPIAVMQSTRAPAAAKAFADYLAGASAAAIFKAHGFTPVAP